MNISLAKRNIYLIIFTILIIAIITTLIIWLNIKSPKPNGIYLSYFFTQLVSKANFHDNILELTNFSNGEVAIYYQYEITDGGEKIELLELKSKEVFSMDYCYSPNDDLVILDGRYYSKVSDTSHYLEP